MVSEELLCTRDLPVDPDHTERAQNVIGMSFARTVPDGGGSPAGRKLAIRSERILDVLSGDWTQPRLAHRCKLHSTGGNSKLRWCCNGRAEAVKKVRSVLKDALFQAIPQVPSKNKWVANYPVLSWIVFATAVHWLLPRLWPGSQQQVRML